MYAKLVLFQGYKVYYTTNPGQVMANWQSQMVDNNQLTTISELTPHTIYTIRVQAVTSVGPGPLSAPVHVKTQQGGESFFPFSILLQKMLRHKFSPRLVYFRRNFNLCVVSTKYKL
jgi:hypothetical protein